MKSTLLEKLGEAEDGGKTPQTTSAQTSAATASIVFSDVAFLLVLTPTIDQIIIALQLFRAFLKAQLYCLMQITDYIKLQKRIITQQQSSNCHVRSK